jgi:hypothetical protein
MLGWLTAAAAHQPIPHLWIGRRQDCFQRHRPLQDFVEGFVHDTHSAASNLTDDAIVPDAIRHGDAWKWERRSGQVGHHRLGDFVKRGREPEQPRTRRQ